MYRKGIAALALGLLLPLIHVLPAPAATTSCAEGSAQTLDVAADARRNSYGIGDTARIDVQVTNSLTGQPEPGAWAGILVESRRDKPLFGYAKTDEDGHALVRVRLSRAAVRPGWPRVTAVAAEAFMTPALCTSTYGSREYRRLFRIER